MHVSKRHVAQFATASRQGRRGASSGGEGVHVAPFESFTNRKVCTFGGDVDMCLWGAVRERGWGKGRRLVCVKDKGE